jgi:SAM-dependent methyltransferase
MSDAFDAEWLALREPFDHAAISRTLANRLAALLPARPRLLDLGAGAGSVFRFLAPVIGRSQAWTLVDAEDALLGEAFSKIATWGEAQGWTVTWPSRALLLHTPRGTWRVEGIVADLAEASSRLPFAQADAVLCGALLDLVSHAWLEHLASQLRSPFLACLNPDGRDAWLPRDRADPIVAAGFRRDQTRDKGFGPALGTRAIKILSQRLAEQGFEVSVATSDWRIPARAQRMLVELASGAAASASAAMPARRTTIQDWHTRRDRQIARARLTVRIGHRDLLAVPHRSR